MKVLITILIFLGFHLFATAQNYDLPENPEAGKCHERCFKYDKRFEWKEIDCAKHDAQRNQIRIKELIRKERQELLKMKAYQYKLIDLGYDLKITGKADNSTIRAHHDYLKSKKS